MFSRELTAAAAKPLILAILSQGESYGYEIIQRVKELSGGTMEWTDGMLYPVLHRLKRQGLITSEVKIAPNGRRRKYYRLEDKGQRALALERSNWMTAHATLGKIWGLDPALT